MKPNGLKNKTRENHEIDGLSPDANKLRDHSEIINVETLTKNIDLAWETTRTPAEFRSKLLVIFRTTLSEGSNFIQDRFLSNNDGAAAVLAQAYLMDSLIKAALETVDTKLYRAPNPTRG